MTVKNEVEGSGHGLISGITPVNCLRALRLATKTLSQDSRSPARDINARHPEYKAKVLTTSQEVRLLIFSFISITMPTQCHRQFHA
jgi:hypothetical protein